MTNADISHMVKQ